MRVEKDNNGFQLLMHASYFGTDPINNLSGKVKELPLVQCSSIRDFQLPDANKPGSSYLWVGSNHHLNRDEVKALMLHLDFWLKTGSLG